jgi:hypothetical protein
MPFLALLLILVISTPCFSQTSKDLIKARGISRKCETIRAEIRSTNDAIDFIEKTYRKKDPDYADFSIRQQQQLLRRLNEEWTRSDCREPAFPAGEKIVRLSFPSRDSIEPRRGSNLCEIIRKETRATHDSIAFIEKTYRIKDPAYADFSIRQQQQLLKRLGEEWTASKCKEPSPTPAKKSRKKENGGKRRERRSDRNPH